MEKVMVLGAKGRFGRAAVDGFAARGWQVTAMGRDWPADTAAQANVTLVEGDVMHTQALIAACMGHDVIVHAVNPAYEDWAKMMPPITKSIIAAAKATGATVLIPGNVYNYGADMPQMLRETTPHSPTTRKGTLREEMERAFQAADVPTIVLRAGDYIDTAQSGNWFDMIIAAKSKRGKTVYPGPLDVPHAWAYLPDVGRAAALLAEQRRSFARFETFGFGGYGITGRELVEGIGETLGKRQKPGGVPWWIFRLLGLFSANIHELIEMRYLWRVAHVVDGAKLAKALPEFKPTPLADALGQALDQAPA